MLNFSGLKNRKYVHFTKQKLHAWMVGAPMTVLSNPSLHVELDKFVLTHTHNAWDLHQRKTSANIVGINNANVAVYVCMFIQCTKST